jgi:hypothetical protein
MSRDASTATCCSSGLAAFFVCHASRTIFAFSLGRTAGIALAPQVSMPSGTEIYCGYTVHWDTMCPSGNQSWNAKAGIVSPPDRSGFCRIISITGSQFASESAARDYVVREAKKWIDEILIGKAGTTAKNQG